jgi:hypothetical protein
MANILAVIDAGCRVLNVPFILESGVVTQEESRRLREQAKLEWLSEDFSGIAFFISDDDGGGIGQGH